MRTRISFTAVLSDEDIEARLGEVEGWSREGDAITKEFDRGDFVGSVEFVRQITEPAEEMGHHPDLCLSWNKVSISITNHAAGGLTPSDFELAARIDALA
jgi:4a-hydroxytetrahydrobiopterin dehydratase